MLERTHQMALHLSVNSITTIITLRMFKTCFSGKTLIRDPFSHVIDSLKLSNAFIFGLTGVKHKQRDRIYSHPRARHRIKTNNTETQLKSHISLIIQTEELTLLPKNGRVEKRWRKIALNYGRDEMVCVCVWKEQTKNLKTIEFICSTNEWAGIKASENVAGLKMIGIILWLRDIFVVAVK